MNSIFKGDLDAPGGRATAWIDSLFVDHAILRLGWSNLAVVEPGVLYRCNHPTPGRIARLHRRLGIETYDLSLESRGAPQADRILRLKAVFDALSGPALMHCKSGADRAGLGAALWVLLRGGRAEAALEQLSWRFGHISRSPTGILDAFVLRYARDGEGRKPFLDWLRDDYDPDALRADFRANGLARFVNDWVLARE